MTWKRALACYLLAVPVLLVCTAASCGPETKTAAEKIAEWANSWRQDVHAGGHPNDFSLPKPPPVALPAAADAIGSDVHSAATTFSVQTGLTQTQGVFCTWFSWYVETGNTVPTQEQFEVLLLKYGFGRVLTAPPSQQFRDAVALFRGAILRAQSESEEVRNAAAAAACSIP